MILAIGLILICIILEGALKLCFKKAADAAEASNNLMMGVVTHPLTYIGIILWALEITIWITALALVPLSIAYPVMSLTYMSVPLASWIFLREKICPRKMIGIALIFAGVLCVEVSDTAPKGTKASVPHAEYSITDRNHDRQR